MTRLTHIGVVGMMVLASLAFMLSPYSPVQVTDNASADPYFSGIERTWDAGSAGDASSPANWNPVGVPATGDNITFDGTSVFNANWNVEVTLGDFSMLTGYTGIVTQSVDFGCVDYLLQVGTYTGSQSYVLTTESFTQTGGVLSETVLRLRIITDSTLTFAQGPIYIYGLQISANVTMTYTVGAGITTHYDGSTYVIIDTGKTFTIANGKYFKADVNSDRTTIWQNNGEVTGTGTLTIRLFRTSWSTGQFGVINCPTILSMTTQTESRSMTLTGPAVFGSTLTLYSEHATFIFTLNHGNNHTLDVTGTVTLANRAIMTQGTGAWSFGSYAQTGVSSVFNQGATLTIGTDFTVSAGVFNAVGDMIVPGNWNTATGDYANDDNVVTLTGASKTLAMNAANSFFNVTVSGSYTMNTDTNVRQRATISGTLAGTGDFKEPFPEFTSVGWPHACPGELYEYEPTQTYWDTLAINDAPYWMVLVGDTVTGIPGENDTGVFTVSLTLTWNDMTVYQNFTLIVCAEAISPYQFASFELAICLFFCFGIMLAGFKEKILMILAGFVWMACGVAIYMDYGDLFMYMSVGLGAVLLIKGAVDLAD